MKKYLSYDTKQKKIILILFAIILAGSVIYSFIQSSKTWLLAFADITFSIGAILLCLFLVGFVFDDHKSFKDYRKKYDDNPDNVKTLKQFQQENRQPSVLLGIGLLVEIVGILFSILDIVIR